MALKSIEDEWSGFAAMIYKKCQPSETQVREQKKAFFAGALAVLWKCKEIGEPHISEEEGIAHLDECEKELDAFHQQMMKEYAETN